MINSEVLAVEDTDRANDQIFWQFKVRQAKLVLEQAKEIFGEDMVVAFSGGKDSLAVLHLAQEVLGEVDVLFNHTTVEFPETAKYVRRLAKDWGFNLIVAKPSRPFLRKVKEIGWASREDRWCCTPYKKEPALNYLASKEISAEIVGTTRTESIYRRSIKPFKKYKDNIAIRVHPIYDWNQWEVWKYIKENELPYNPLYDMGYQRIGCWCCPLNGVSHYKRLRKTHPKMYSFLTRFKPTHPQIQKLEGL